MTAKDEFGQK